MGSSIMVGKRAMALGLCFRIRKKRSFFPVSRASRRERPNSRCHFFPAFPAVSLGQGTRQLSRQVGNCQVGGGNTAVDGPVDALPGEGVHKTGGIAHQEDIAPGQGAGKTPGGQVPDLRLPAGDTCAVGPVEEGKEVLK